MGNFLFTNMGCVGGMAQWFGVLDLKSEGPRFKSFMLPLNWIGFVLGSLTSSESDGNIKSTFTPYLPI